MQLSDTLNDLAGAKPLSRYTLYDMGIVSGSAFEETVEPPLYHDLWNGEVPRPYRQAALSSLTINVIDAKGSILCIKPLQN